MLDIDHLFPAVSDAMKSAFENAPRSLMAVNAAVNYQQALGLHDPRYESTTLARAEKFEQIFYKTFNYSRERGEFVPPQRGKHVLFFGHVGCGKSTELTQLCAELHHPDRYWVVRVDLLDLIDPNDARYCDVWLAVAERLVKALQDDDVPVTPVVLDRLQRWFTERVLATEQVKDFAASVLAEAELGVGIPFVSKLLARFTSAIKIGSTYRESLRTVVQNTYGEFVAALNVLIIDVTEQLQRISKGRCILFAIDGTDRFKGEDWKRLFVDDVNQLTLINAIAVYTAPMALKSSGARLDMFETIVLPMIKLHEFDSSKSPPRRDMAYRTMRAIVLKRCHHSLFDSVETLDALIDWSGGHLRDALRLLAYAGVEADADQLTRSEIDAAAKRLAGDYRAWLHAEHYPLLVAAARDPENTGTSEAITMLVEKGALLEYNTGSWRQPHPVLSLLPGYTRAFNATQANA
jgi:hypothetical protein